MSQPVIDVFCHWMPPELYKAATKIAPASLHMLDRASRMPVMCDIEKRIALMDTFPGYKQLPYLVSPALEAIAGPDQSPELAMIANDACAEWVRRYPDYFPSFIAALPLNNPEASVAEAERAVGELGACGVQIFTNVNGKPLDEAHLFPLFERMAELDLPILMHPVRGMNHPDYLTESYSKFELWWALGWPYETSVAMGRLVFAGVFDRWPHLKIITHHVGGMIPMMEGRLGSGLDLIGTRTPERVKEAVQTSLQERPVDAFRRFYADTASFGSAPAILCGASFFGWDKLLFASDMPFDPEQGPGYIRDTLKAVHELGLSSERQRHLLFENACKLFKLRLSNHEQA